jgi:AGCS family alanine or glycine:cation symporter
MLASAFEPSALQPLTEAITAVDAVVWRPYAMPTVLVVVGGYLTYVTGAVQLRRFGAAARMLARSAGSKGGDDGTISPFQALSTALAATVGNGNIGGVATAILAGGPGAIFWMWIIAAVGMATKYAEAVLGVHYRVDRGGGDLASGPMYYLSRGLPSRGLGRVLALAFCFFGLITALVGTGNMAQANTIAITVVQAAKVNFGVVLSPWIPGIVISAMTAAVLLGGIKRIAAVSEMLVPGMILLYVAAGLAYIALNFAAIPGVLAMILGDAFTGTAAVGGFAGAGVQMAIAQGVSRGVLSNEAGLGSAPIAHGIAKVEHPVQQGLVGIFEVFIDTIVVCSMTAFIILSSGLWTQSGYQSGDLTAAALGTSIPRAALLVATCSFLFGFSTVLGWYYYGEKCFEFLFGSRLIVGYKAVFVALILVGSVVKAELVWALGTLLNGFMAFPNLIGLFGLAGVVAQLTRDYFAGRPYSPPPP